MMGRFVVKKRIIRFDGNSDQYHSIYRALLSFMLNFFQTNGKMRFVRLLLRMKDIFREANIIVIDVMVDGR